MQFVTLQEAGTAAELVPTSDILCMQKEGSDIKSFTNHIDWIDGNNYVKLNVYFM